MNFGAFLFVATAAQLHSAPGEYPLLEQAKGFWELDPAETEDVGDFRCDATPLQITIDAHALRYASIAGEYRYEANILSIEGDRFWIRYDDENGLTTWETQSNGLGYPPAQNISIGFDVTGCKTIQLGELHCGGVAPSPSQ